MRDGFLERADVVRIARQVVDLLDPAIVIDIKTDQPSDASGRAKAPPGWMIWPRVDGQRSFGTMISYDMRPVDVVYQLLWAMAESVSEEERWWGMPFPPWLDHPHDANVEIDAADVLLVCPVDGAELQRIRPSVTGSS